MQERILLMKYMMENRMKFTFDSCIKELFPEGFKTELKDTIKLAVPVILHIWLQYVVVYTSLIICGQLSKENLNGASMAISMVIIFGISPLLGLTFGCDCFFPQIYGSKYRKYLGIAAQRSFLIVELASFVCVAILINTQSILLISGQNFEVARLAGKYTTIYSFSLPAIGFVNVILKYLEAQRIVIPSIIIGTITSAINIGLHVLFLFYFKLGIEGAALSACFVMWLSPIIHMFYITISGIYKETWSGFSKEAFLDWWKFLTVAIYSALMVNLKKDAFEVLILIAGILGNDPLSAQTVNTFTNQYITVIFGTNIVRWYDAYLYASSGALFKDVLQIGNGFNIASAIRIGNFLGNHQPDRGKTSYRVISSISVLLGVTIATLILALRRVIPVLFSSDRNVIQLSSNLIPLMALFTLFDFPKMILTGPVKGLGKQKYGAMVFLIGFYIIAIPIGTFFALQLHLGVYGLWWGLCISAVIQYFAYVIKLERINWNEESEKVESRIGIKKEPAFSYSSLDCSNIQNGSEISSQKDGDFSDGHTKWILIQKLLIVTAITLILICGIMIRIFLQDILERKYAIQWNNKINITDSKNSSNFTFSVTDNYTLIN